MKELTLTLSSKNTREAINTLINDQFEDYLSCDGRYTLVDHSIRGNKAWILVCDQQKGDQCIQFIRCTKNKDNINLTIESDAEKPDALDCPLKLIGKATSTIDSAVEWYSMCKSKAAREKEIDRIVDESIASGVKYILEFELKGERYSFIQLNTNRQVLARKFSNGMLDIIHPYSINIEVWRKIDSLTKACAA